MRFTITVVLFLIGITAVCAWSQTHSRVAKRVLRTDTARLREWLVNVSFEQPAPETGAAAWNFWQDGFEAVTNEAHSGNRSARCVSDDPTKQFGAGQRVQLDQRTPLPIIAGGWSKAVEVDGSPDGGYSIYVDAIYQDGSELWGQISPFSVGTHDWEYRELTIFPERPIASLIVYGLFRGHRGAVYFDDLTVKEVNIGGGAAVFDRTPVVAQEGAWAAGPTRGYEIEGDGKLKLVIDPEDGRVCLAGQAAQDSRPGGCLVRDVAANSDFLQPILRAERSKDGVRLTGKCPELDLDVSLSVAPYRGAVRLDGAITDLTGQDRAISVYWTLPLDLSGGEWPDDMRSTRPIKAGESYGHFSSVGVGLNGLISRYPLAAPSSGKQRLALATPLNRPRVSRMCYDAGSREFYVVFDLGLTPDTKKFPSRATFSALIYDFDPVWGFRSALKRYYAIFPEFFKKRIAREGIWMPFTDIAIVQRHESFGFRFHEGSNNVPWDEEHDIYSFVYVEPMSYWMPMASDTPRTYEAAMAQLERQQSAPKPAQYRQAQAVLSSAVQTAPGRLVCHLLKAPWCDGALFILNPDPDLRRHGTRLTQAAHELATIEKAFKAASQLVAPGWSPWGEGFQFAPGQGRGGGGAISCNSDHGGHHGASQTMQLSQQRPTPIVAACWSRAKDVTGAPNSDYSLYLDIRYADGAPSWGHHATFAVGTHDWERVEVRFTPEKPIQSIFLHLLFRGEHTGVVWFDDVVLREDGKAANAVVNPSFGPAPEPVKPPELDGVYIDSMDMAAFTQNCRREHWAAADEPLTFSFQSRRVCSLVLWHTYEFARDLSERLHRRGKLLMANSVLKRTCFPAHVLDVMGTETNWAPGGVYAPESDDIMNFRRALCYQKPYLLLLNTDYNAFKPEWVNLYFQRCLFYGIFPSFFSHNAADDQYWANPKLYNRDRPLFEKTIPVIQNLNAAGWAPVTLARADNPNVYLERYGGPEKEHVFLTFYNPTDQEQMFSATIEWEKLGVEKTAKPNVIFAGEGCSVEAGQATSTLTGRLGPQRVLCVKLK